MKNFLKRKKRDQPDTEAPAARITNETVAENREKVLTGGRKFKYPLQYQKHRLVINSIVIVIAAIVVMVAFIWYELYVAEDAGQLSYRITQLIPVRVASVDGEPVLYSDYLLRYRSSVFYAQKQDALNLNDANGRRQAAYYQRQELTNAERSAYVVKLAREQHLTVTSKEVDSFITQDINARSVSLNAYEKTVLNSYYDWSLDEYRTIVRSELLKRKVSFAIDTAAKDRATALLQKLQSGADFAALATAESDDDTTKANGGDSGVLPLNNLDQNGLLAVAKTLTPNQVSGLIQGVDGYYIVQLISLDKDTVRYRDIKVGLSAFDTQFSDLQKNHKIKEYITVSNQ